MLFQIDHPKNALVNCNIKSRVAFSVGRAKCHYTQKGAVSANQQLNYLPQKLAEETYWIKKSTALTKSTELTKYAAEGLPSPSVYVFSHSPVENLNTLIIETGSEVNIFLHHADACSCRFHSNHLIQWASHRWGIIPSDALSYHPDHDQSTVVQQRGPCNSWWICCLPIRLTRNSTELQRNILKSGCVLRSDDKTTLTYSSMWKDKSQPYFMLANYSLFKLSGIYEVYQEFF